MSWSNIKNTIKSSDFKRLNSTFRALLVNYGVKNTVKACLNKAHGKPLLYEINSSKALDGSIYAGSEINKRGNFLFKEQQAEFEQCDKNIKENTLFSIVIPVYNPELDYLEKCIESVLDQVYKNWELILVDDGSRITEHHSYLDELNKKYKNIIVIKNKENGGISKATNDGIKAAKGKYIIFMDQDDAITKDALFWFAKEVEKNPDLEWIYSDECKIDPAGKNLYSFYIKPDFSLSLLFSHMYTGHLTAYTKAIIEKAGYLRTQFDFSQDYDLALRISKIAKKISHINRILYFWRSIPGSGSSGGKDFARISNSGVIKDYYEKEGIEGICVPRLYCNYFLPKRKENDLVSIIIPSDSLTNLESCITNIHERTFYTNYEILVVSNSLVSKKLKKRFAGNDFIVPVPFDEPFNFSRKCNKGAAAAKGKYILILNDDVEVVYPDWIDRMIDKMCEPDVASVSPLCLDVNGGVQFAGMMSGIPGIITTCFNGNNGLKAESETFHHLLPRDILICSGACCLIRKDYFDEVDGFDEINTPNGHSDVVLAFKFIQKGYRNVYNPSSIVKHIGNHTWHEKEKADKCDIFLLKHYSSFLKDPYFTHCQNFVYSPFYNNTNFKIYCPDKVANTEAKKDILFVTHELTLSGAPVVLLPAVKAALEQGLFVTVVSGADGPLKDEFLKLGVNVIVDNSYLMYPDAFKRFAVNFDFVWVNTIACAPVISILGKTRTKLIWWIHEGSYALTVFKKLMPKKIENNVKIYYVSDYSRKIFTKEFSGYDGDILYFGFESLPKFKHEENNFVNFGIIGNIEYRKGYQRLVKAIDKLKPETKEKVRVHVLANKVDLQYKNIEKEISTEKTYVKYDHIKRDQIYTFYKPLDCVIVPSLDEPFSMVACEGMSCGLPAIVSEETGAKDLLANRTNEYFVFKTVKELTRYIEFVVKNKNDLLENKLQEVRKNIITSQLSYEIFRNNFKNIIDSADKSKCDAKPSMKNIDPKIDERKNLILSSNKTNILYIYDREKENISTFRYRVFNICEALYSSSKFGASFLYLDEINEAYSCLDKTSIIVFSRVQCNEEVSSLIASAKAKGIKVVFDMDDIIFDRTKIMPMLENFNIGFDDVNAWLSSSDKYTKTAKMADCVMSTNEFLSSYMEEFFKLPSYVIPNTICNDLYNESIKARKCKKNKKFIIGYFSGSRTHNGDFAVVAKPIFDFLSTHKDAHLLIVGELDLPKYFNHLIKQIDFVKFVSPHELVKLTAKVHLNIIPLEESLFTNSKSELKFFEASIVNVPTVATPTFVYKKCITNKKNGFLASDYDEWLKAITDVYSGAYSNDLISEARKYCEDNYVAKNLISDIENVFEKVLGSSVNKVKEFSAKKSKFPLSFDKYCIKKDK